MKYPTSNLYSSFFRHLALIATPRISHDVWAQNNSISQSTKLTLELYGFVLDIIFLIKFQCLHPQLNLTDKETILVRTNTVHKLVGLLYHQFYLNADSDTLRQFYLSCIRPHLEYAYTVWDPYLAKERTLLEALCKSLPAKYAVRTDIWTMRACWVI